MDRTTMSGLMDGLYQQQRFYTNFPPRFELNSAHGSALSLYTNASNGIVKPETDVKMELQEKIKLKYIESGEEPPKLEFRESEPPKPKPKEEEDPETIMRRRERNKIAATKCRRRKRERIVKLEHRANEIRAKRTQLEKEKSELLKEWKDLTGVLNNHCCKLPPAPVPANFQPGLDPSSNNKESRFLALLSQMQAFGNLQH